MNETVPALYRLIALSIVGGVAKALFAPGWGRQVSEGARNVYNAAGSHAADLATDVAKSVTKS